MLASRLSTPATNDWDACQAGVTWILFVFSRTFSRCRAGKGRFLVCGCYSCRVLWSRVTYVSLSVNGDVCFALCLVRHPASIGVCHGMRFLTAGTNVRATSKNGSICKAGPKCALSSKLVWNGCLLQVAVSASLKILEPYNSNHLEALPRIMWWEGWMDHAKTGINWENDFAALLAFVQQSWFQVVVGFSMRVLQCHLLS